MRAYTLLPETVTTLLGSWVLALCGSGAEGEGKGLQVGQGCWTKTLAQSEGRFIAEEARGALQVNGE